MLKITTSYSKKVPGEQEYSSEGVLVSLEAEVPEALLGDTRALRGRMESLFHEAKSQVDAQLNGGDGNGSGIGLRSSSRWPSNGNSNGNGERKSASPKQIQYLVALGRRKLDFGPQEIAEHAGVDDLRELTAVQASEMIQSLKDEGS